MQLNKKLLAVLILGIALGAIGVYATQVFVTKLLFVISRPPAELELKTPRIEVAPYQTYTIGMGTGSDTAYIILGTVKQYSDCVVYTFEATGSNIRCFKITIELNTAMMPGPEGRLGTVTLSSGSPEATIKICNGKLFYLYIVRGEIKTENTDGYLEIKVVPKATP